MKIWLSLFLVSSVCHFLVHANDFEEICSSDFPPITRDSTPHQIPGDFLFLEGPTWSPHQKVFYFSEMNFSSQQNLGPSAKIYRLALPDQVSVFIGSSGSNGLFTRGKWLYAMSHSTQSVSRFSLETKTKTVIADQYKGQAFLSPNDGAMHKNGHIYFTDPDWQLGTREPELPFTGVYKIDQLGNVTLVDGTLNKPNGIVFSKDYDALYVGDLGNKIYRFDVDLDGNVFGRKQVFAEVQTPDGMTIDCAGNLYVASHTKNSIIILSPKGQVIDEIQVGANTTNVEFGGDDFGTLLITTANGLFTLRTNIPGIRNH